MPNQISEVTPRGRQSVVKYKEYEIILNMPLSDARVWAAAFEAKVDVSTKEEVARWLGSHSAVASESRDQFGRVEGLAPRDEVLQNAIEHTDPAWRYLGVDETAGDPDLRTFSKTKDGFVRAESAEKSPGIPDEGDVKAKKSAPHAAAPPVEHKPAVKH